jgi:hypothetical protein
MKTGFQKRSQSVAYACLNAGMPSVLNAFLILLQQAEQPAVELMTVPVGVFNVGPA